MAAQQPTAPHAQVRGRILGVDPGTRVVGYAIIDVTAPGRFDYVECGVLKVSRPSDRAELASRPGDRADRVRAADDLSARLLELGGALREVIAEFGPAGLAIERAFHGLNAASALKLAEARGALKLIALEHGLSVSEYAPAMIKRAVVGRGRATKAEVQARVRLLCRLGSAPEADAADALAIAICHVQASRLPNVDVPRLSPRLASARRRARAKLRRSR